MKKTIFFLTISLIAFNVSAQKQIALTFDDAPDSSYTETILDILKKENVKATFFVLGEKSEKYPEIIKRIHKEGHVIGNHSTAHKNFLEYEDSTSLVNDVNFVDSVIFSIIGEKTIYLRPPYGTIRDEQSQMLKNKGYKITMWTLSTKDWDVHNITKTCIIDTVKKYHHENAIILLHSKNAQGKIEDYPFRNNTIEALPEVIHFLKEENYEFVTIDKLKTNIETIKN